MKPKRGRITVIVLAAGAAVILVAVLQVWLTRSDKERIQGEWKLDSAINSGQTVSEFGSCVFEGETVTFDFGDRVVKCAYRLDEGHQPAWLDLIVPKKSTTIRGIYELDGRTLRICLNERSDERPNAFESRARSPNDLLMVLKR